MLQTLRRLRRGMKEIASSLTNRAEGSAVDPITRAPHAAGAGHCVDDAAVVARRLIVEVAPQTAGGASYHTAAPVPPLERGSAAFLRQVRAYRLAKVALDPRAKLKDCVASSKSQLSDLFVAANFLLETVSREVSEGNPPS